MLPKTSAYVKNYDRENDELLEKYNTILEKVSTDIKKEFGTESVYN